MIIRKALVPLGIGVAVIAIAVWLMLVNDVALGPWLLALLLFGNGWVHLMFVFPKPESPNADDDTGYPFEFGRSWLIRSAGLDAGLVRGIGIVLMVVIFVLYLLAALSTVGLIVPTDWWAGLMMGAALSSTLMLALFYSPALVLGFAINAAVILLVLSDSWSPS